MTRTPKPRTALTRLEILQAIADLPTHPDPDQLVEASRATIGGIVARIGDMHAAKVLGLPVRWNEQLPAGKIRAATKGQP